MNPQNTSSTRNILVGVVVIIIVILFAVFLIRRNQTNNLINTNSALPTPVATFNPTLPNNFGITVPSGATTANLHDVTGSNQMGLATLDTSNGLNKYTIVANLNDPSAGYFYQAWLVNGTNYISLGKLSVTKAGYLLNYNSPVNISDHKVVWITLEKVFDATPETHVLEGSF
ncbi:MAG TPA: anti-sigma factor [Patescibacteria group bacterium]|nr:anti-sigma factor [Patescibacteria group bacterium]